MTIIGKATKRIVTTYVVAIICDSCGRANQYGVGEEGVRSDVPCGTVECEVVFSRDDVQALVDDAS